MSRFHAWVPAAVILSALVVIVDGDAGQDNATIERWASKDLTEEHLDPDFLMWALRRMVRREEIPAKRMVALFRFRREAKRQYWLVLKQPDVDLCLLDPGFDVDVEVHAETEVLARVCLGQLQLLQAVKAGGIALSGAPRHRRALCECLGVTRFAGAPTA